MSESKTFHAHGLAVHGGGQTSPGPEGAEDPEGLLESGSRGQTSRFAEGTGQTPWREAPEAALPEGVEQNYAERRAKQLVAAFDGIARTDPALEQFNAMYRRRQAIARLEESDGEPYSESSLHAAFEWLLTRPFYPVRVQHERLSLDETAWAAMHRAFTTVHPDLVEEFFKRARQARFETEPAALAKALQIAMLRYVERGTSDHLV